MSCQLPCKDIGFYQNVRYFRDWIATAATSAEVPAPSAEECAPKVDLTKLPELPNSTAPDPTACAIAPGDDGSMIIVTRRYYGEPDPEVPSDEGRAIGALAPTPNGAMLSAPEEVIEI